MEKSTGYLMIKKLFSAGVALVIVFAGIFQLILNNFPLNHFLGKQRFFKPSPKTNFHHPPGVRICCAFGYDLELPLMPFVRIFNTVKLNDFFESGHYYGGSLFENNGLIYTCRGGFIDTGHVRDWADWTLYLFQKLKTHFRSGKPLYLPNQGTEMIRVDIVPGTLPIDEATLLLLAQRIAFDYSVWHEFATLMGYTIVPVFYDEVASAFSPEDLYSNLLGTLIGGKAIVRNENYSRTVNNELHKTLHLLKPLTEQQTRSVLDSVEGHWWSRDRAVTDHNLVTRRYVDYQEKISPWRVPVSACPSEPALPLSIPQLTQQGHPLSAYYRMVIHPQKKIRSSFPAFDQDDAGKNFYKLLEQTRQIIRNMFGPKADLPDF